jgi:hypothetical protein
MYRCQAKTTVSGYKDTCNNKLKPEYQDIGCCGKHQGSNFVKYHNKSKQLDTQLVKLGNLILKLEHKCSAILARPPLIIIQLITLPDVWIRNAKGTSKDSDRIKKSIYKSAIKLYEAGTKTKRDKCFVQDCEDEKRSGLVGVHVHILGELFRKNMYIVPLCRHHNKLYAVNGKFVDDKIVKVQEDPLSKKEKVWMHLRENSTLVHINY